MANLKEKQKLKQKLKTATPTEATKLKKTIIGLEEEEIDLMGQDSDTKAATHVKEVRAEEEQANNAWYDAQQQRLEDSKHKPHYYKAILLQLLNNEIAPQLTKQNNVTLWETSKGYEVVIKTKNRTFKRGVSVSWIPKYDLAAALTLAESTIYFIDHYGINKPYDLFKSPSPTSH